MSNALAGSGLRPWQGLLLTLGLSLVPVAAQHVPLPGIHGSLPLELVGPNTSIGALGISPLLSAFITVELVALLVPRWNRLRHGYPDGRARLTRSVTVLALILSAFQAFGVAMMLGASEVGVDVSLPLVMASLVAMTALLIAAARAVEHLELVNGVLVLAVASNAVEALTQLPSVVLPSQPLALAATGVAVLLPVVATWLVFRLSEPRAQVGPVQLSVPSSSVQPLAVAAALLALPKTLLELDVARSWRLAELARGPHRVELQLLAALLACWLCSYLLQRPRLVLRRLGAVAGDGSDVTQRSVRQALGRSLWPTLVFLLALFACDQVAAEAGLPSPLGADLALLTALVLDGSNAWRARRAVPELVCVWREQRPYLVPSLLAAAAARGIELRVTGLATTSLLRVFGPYTAVGLWCAASEAAAARETLGPLLTRASRPAQETPSAESASQPAPSVAAPRRLAWPQGALFVVAAALLLWVRFDGPAAFAHRAEVGAVVGELDVVAVDDSVDRLGSESQKLPAGVAIFTEYIPLGPGRHGYHHYARLVLQPGESYEQAISRLEPWLTGLALPKDTWVAWQAIHADDNAPLGFASDGELAMPVEGFRSYFLSKAPIVTEAQVKNVGIATERGDGSSFVDLRLTPEGQQRFALATRQLFQRRIAILVDGLVKSAPELQTEITGGQLQIHMGGDDPARMAAEARALLRQLTGQRR